tara:strand:+ start:112 stop:360 length:249 start_codon:yes stop_codon:yes gene_type:complete
MSNTRLIIISTTIAVLVMFFSYHLYFSQEARCLKAEMGSMQYGGLLFPDNLYNQVKDFVDEDNNITELGKAEAHRLCNIKSK